MVDSEAPGRPSKLSLCQVDHQYVFVVAYLTRGHYTVASVVIIGTRFHIQNEIGSKIHVSENAQASMDQINDAHQPISRNQIARSASGCCGPVACG
jgi:hypothetical protein